MLTTPPLAPKTLAALKELGIRTREDLQKIGAVRAFLLLKASGLTVTKSTLWQLDALVSGVDVRHISEERKTELGEALKNHPPVAVFPSQNDMEAFMWLAIEQARQSAALGEV
ncbi:TfoX/Sxy family DNA transformation protein, partial [Neisseria sp.]